MSATRSARVVSVSWPTAEMTGTGQLKIDRTTSERFRCFVHRHLTGMKPGWVRLSLPYYASEEDLEFLLASVEFVAEHGLELVPEYRFSFADGVWRHRADDRPDELFNLFDDPLEKSNLANERKATVKERRGALMEWRGGLLALYFNLNERETSP